MDRITSVWLVCCLAACETALPDTGERRDAEYPSWITLEEPDYWGWQYSQIGIGLAVGSVNEGEQPVIIAGVFPAFPGDVLGSFAEESGGRLVSAPFDGGDLDEVAAVKFFGTTAGSGYDLSISGDLTGDGSRDVLIHSGALAIESEERDGQGWFVHSGPFADGDSPSEWTADASVPIGTATGRGFVGHDVDGDGQLDFCACNGIVTGPLTERWEVPDYRSTFDAELISTADLDGDGSAVLVVAQKSSKLDGDPTISVLPEDVPEGEVDLLEAADVVWTIQGIHENGKLETGHDLDGDGREDLVFANASWSSEEAAYLPQAYVFVGTSGGDMDDAYATFEYQDHTETYTLSAGDFDADGHSDLALAEFTGLVALHFGPLTAGHHVNTDADVLISCVTEEWYEEHKSASLYFGERLATGDLDLDGRDDLVIAQPRTDGPDGDDQAGLLYILWGAEL